MKKKMPSKKNEGKIDPYVHYNSLISLKLVSNHYYHSQYLIRMENLEENLLLKLCKSPLIEQTDLKESLFFIRDIDECQSIYGKKRLDDTLNSKYILQNINLKETSFLNNSKLNFNQRFFLQHMMSKKFITIEKLQGNDNYSLKLVVEVESAMPFCFNRISETRSPLEPLIYKNIVYLSVYNEEKGQFYFINHCSFDKINLEKNENINDNSENENEGSVKDKKNKLLKSNYSDLCLANNAIDKFSIINQSWYINKKDYLYSGQLINIIFTNTKNQGNKKMMLSAQGIKVENKIEEIIGIKEEVREDIDGMLKDNNQKYVEFHGATDRIKEKINTFSSIKIKGLAYDENLFEHVVNNSFWVIENENFRHKDETYERQALKIGDLVKIKNPLLGLYLRIKKKEKEQKNNSETGENNNIIAGNLSTKNINILNNNINTNNNALEEDEYEFELVNEEELEKQYYTYNFKFFHYNVNEENQNMVADGKYVLKSVFRVLNDNTENNQNKVLQFDYKEKESYFEPIFLTMKNESDSISIKIEDDYILEIRKIDINEGNQAIYLQNVIIDLDYILKSYKKKKTSSNSIIKKITQYINYFNEYLLNIDYTFKDDNYEMNHPISYRQKLLDRFNILATIVEIIQYFLPTVKDIKMRNTSIKKNSKKLNNIYSNREKDKLKDSLQMNLQSSQIGGKDTTISNLKSMLQLILKFLIYLSEKNEDIKQKIFINISSILEFSEYIYIEDRSDLLNFIFDILKDSESLQEYIIVGKLKLSKNNKNIHFRPDKVLFINKILSYIETTYNYLYYYKKLIHLNKIRYKVEEIKDKIKQHIQKVQIEFNSRKKSNNYKGKIYRTIIEIKLLVLEQIKYLNKYLEEKQIQDEKNENEKNKLVIKRGKTHFVNNDNKLSSDNLISKRDESKYKSQKNVNFIINTIKEDNSSSISSSKNNYKKIDTDDKNDNAKNNRSLNQSNFEDNNYGAESNDYLNDRSDISPTKTKKKGILNRSPIRRTLLNDISNNTTSKDQSINNNINKSKSQENDFSNIYSAKKSDDDFEAYANKKISDLKLILIFIKYFKQINLDSLLFTKDEYFSSIFNRDIKEEFLENNLNYVINGSNFSVKFINNNSNTNKSDLYKPNSLIGSLFPYRIFNLFFNEYDEDNINFETKNIIEEVEAELINEESKNDNSVDNDKTELYKSIHLVLEHDNEEEEEEEDDDNEDDNSKNISKNIKKEENKNNSNNKNNSESNDEDSENEEDEKDKTIKKSSFKQTRGNIFNFSSKKIKRKTKKSNNKIAFNINDEDKKDGKVDEKEKGKFPKIRKSIRNDMKHQTVNVFAKAVHFQSKFKRFLNNEPKKGESEKIQEKCKEDDQKINKNLYIVYSIYIFCINEYMEIVYKTYKILFNLCVNFNNFSNIQTIKGIMNSIKEKLLQRVVFINNNCIKNIYSKMILNPTLLKDHFKIENFNAVENKNDFANMIEYDDNEEENDNAKNNNNENKNKGRRTIFNFGTGNDINNKDNKFFFNGSEFIKLKVLTKEEIILLDYLIYYCRKNDQIIYILEKIECFKKLKKLIAELEMKENNENTIVNTNIKTNKTFLNLMKDKIANKSKNNNNNEEYIIDDNQIEDEFKNIIEKIVKNRCDILILYEELNDVKNQFLYSYKNSLGSNIFEDYGIGKQADFMIQLLEQYEIDNYFDKIIYLDVKNNSIFNHKNSFEKLKNIQDVFKMIEGEIQKIKEENEIINFNDLSSHAESSFSPRRVADNKNNDNHYKIINNKLQTITKKNLLNIFSMKEIKKEGVNKLIQMLIKENENFFEKIGFAKSLRIMVESIEKYNDKKTVNNNDTNENNSVLKLNYCKEILRVFIEVQSVFPKFKKLVPDNFDLYQNMICNSLNCIKGFHGNIKENESEEEKLYLCICYYCSESLLFLLKNSKKSFEKLREFMIKVFEKLKEVYNICKNPKNKVIFQLFYNYLVTRILILLNKEKNIDSFIYESFLNNIYPENDMKIRILSCMNVLQSDDNSNNNNDNEEEDEEDEDNEENKEIDDSKDKKDSDEDDDKKSSWLDNIYVNKDKKSDSSNEDKNNTINKDFGQLLREKNINTYGAFGLSYTSNKKDKVIWENDEEKEKLSFLLYFSSSYIIYLKDKNIISNNNINNYYEEHSDIKFSFRELSKKITKLLDSNINTTTNVLEKNNNYEPKKRDSSVNSLRSSSLTNLRGTNFNKQVLEDNNNSINNTNNNIDNEKLHKKKSFNNLSYITKNYNINNEIIKCENKFNFEIILLESIAGFKYSIKGNNLEIPIRKRRNKYEFNNMESNNFTSKSEEEKEEEIVRKNDPRLITFYYYRLNCLDIILLEKIFKGIEIKENLEYYCTNTFTNEEYESLEKSSLLTELLELQKKFDIITYQEIEYDILQKQFIKNDMEKFIKKIFRNFHENDLKDIDMMQDYIYNRMNEIYPSENLYNNYESEVIKSLVKTLKIWEDDVQREFLKIDNELLKKEKVIVYKSIKHIDQIDLFTFFNSLIYLDTKYNKKICLIFFRIGFELLYAKCSNVDSNKNKENINSNEPQLNLYSILNGIILIFSRKDNHSLIKSKNIFFVIVKSINLFLKKIQDNHIFISKNYKLIQKLFHKLDFVLDHLSDDFEKIFNFMKSPESQEITNKYKKMENSLNLLITFITTLIGFKKIDKNILTKEINKFSQDMVEKIIKLISNSLEKNQETSFNSIDLLLNFIYYFIDGPDIDNLNTLFNNGYFDLVSDVIKKIDYYKIFLSHFNKENLNEIIDSVIEIEYRIIKVFFIYYNICHKEYKKLGFTSLRDWYKDNIKNIKNKLKKIYYLSKKEMENREYNIDKMLLSLKDDDSYNDEELRERAGNFEYNSDKVDNVKDDKELFEEDKKDNNKIEIEYSEVIEGDDGNDDNLKEKEKILLNENKNNQDENNNRKRNYDYCLIKFDLLLIYYTLYSYHQDSINESYLSVPLKKNIFRVILKFFYDCLIYIINLLLCIYHLIMYIYKHYSNKKKKEPIELLQELSDIDIKCQSIDENEMFRFLTGRIKCVEVSLNYILYKVYFPLLNKAKQIQDNNEMYFKVDNTQLSNFVNIILNSYDKINLTATVDYKINKLFDLPFLKIIFNNNNLYSILLVLTSITQNILIVLSYSTFTEECTEENYESPKQIRLFCPHLLYSDTYGERKTMTIFNYFGFTLFVLQSFLFLEYISRRFAESIVLYYKISYRKKELLHQRSGGSFSYIIYYIPQFLKIIFDFQTIYYLLCIFFIILGIVLHPFFYCFTLLELVNKVETMQAVLKAMYVPMDNILITLLMFIMLLYIFSMFALSIYTTHFPGESDTNNFLKTFMRMFDQTFKQDGGIGTYLKQDIDPNFTPYIAISYSGGRFFFDLLFYLLINMLIFQMFLSMIINYFNTTKENMEDFQKTFESKCLICELEREYLEKIYSNLKDAFDLHVNHFHSLGDYIAYLVYLQGSDLKDPIIDEQIWKLHLSNNFKYLPKGTCFKEIEKKLEKNMKK